MAREVSKAAARLELSDQPAQGSDSQPGGQSKNQGRRQLAPARSLPTRPVQVPARRFSALETQ